MQPRVGDDRHLNLVDDAPEVGMEAGVQDVAEVLQVEALVGRPLADADPGDVALADVLDTGGAVDEVVDLPLQHRFEVLLHLAAGDAHQDPHVHGALILDGLKPGPDDLDLPIFDLVEIVHEQVLERPALLAAELAPHIVLAHDLAFEGRPVGHRDGHVGDLDLDAAHLDAFLDQALGPLQVVLAGDFVERHRHDVLVGGDAGGQDLGDDRVGHYREAEVDGAGGRRIFLIREQLLLRRFRIGA